MGTPTHFLMDFIPRVSEKRVLHWIGVATVYLLIALALTYPLAFQLGTHLAGDSGDPEQAVWEIWWYREALMQHRVHPADVRSLFHPDGAYAPAITLQSYPALMGLLLSFLDPRLTYNLIFLSSFIMTGLATYALCLRLTGDRPAAFLGGVVYAFSAYNLAQATAGHVWTIQLQWFPLLALGLITLFNQPRPRTGLASGVVFGIVLLTHPVYAAFFGALFPIAFALYQLTQGWRPSKPFLQAGGLGLVIALIVTIPWLGPFVSQLIRGEAGYGQAMGTVEFSPDLLSFFLPPPDNPVLRLVDPLENLSRQAVGRNVYEGIVYLGLIAVTLSFVAVRRDLQKTFFWLALGLSAAVLSLGPFLRVGGEVWQYWVEGRSSHLILPYALVKALPVLSMGRTPGSFSVITTLCLAVLASFGGRRVLARLPTRVFKWAGATGLAAIFLLESLVRFPFPTGPAAPHPAYDSIRDLAPGNGVLEFPLPGSGAGSRPMLYQTYHRKPLVGGYLVRVPQETAAKAEEIARWVLPGDIVRQPGRSPLQLNQWKVGAVILHGDLLEPQSFDSIARYLERDLGLPVYLQDDLIIFRVPDEPSPQLLAPEFELVGGWYGLEIRSGIPTRWVETEASIRLSREEPWQGRVRFNASSFHRTRRFEVEVNGQVVGQFEAPRDVFATYVTEPVRLSPGTNLLRFRSLSGCDVPLALGVGLDGRCLSVALQDVELAEKV